MFIGQCVYEYAKFKSVFVLTTYLHIKFLWLDICHTTKFAFQWDLLIRFLSNVILVAANSVSLHFGTDFGKKYTIIYTQKCTCQTCQNTAYVCVKGLFHIKLLLMCICHTRLSMSSVKIFTSENIKQKWCS